MTNLSTAQALAWPGAWGACTPAGSHHSYHSRKHVKTRQRGYLQPVPGLLPVASNTLLRQAMQLEAQVGQGERQEGQLGVRDNETLRHRDTAGTDTGCVVKAPTPCWHLGQGGFLSPRQPLLPQDAQEQEPPCGRHQTGALSLKALRGGHSSQPRCGSLSTNESPVPPHLRLPTRSLIYSLTH